MRTFKNIFALGVSMVLSVSVLADVPKLVNYQGLLTNSSGTPLKDSTYSVTFTIFDAPTGGTNLWTENQSVVTTDGLFTVHLGAVNSLVDSVFSNSTRYLGIQVNPNPEFSPRDRIVSTGYSYRVGSVDGALGGTITSKITFGSTNINTGTDAFVAGANNKARGEYSVVSGGGDAIPADSNAANGDYSTIGGGLMNVATGFASIIGGGQGNSASGSFATVGGGESNSASGNYVTVNGGVGNTGSGLRATVSGGEGNFAGGYSATVPGGSGCNATGNFSLAAGRQGKALHDGAFVWGDGADAPFSSTASNQFLIRASGGVGIGTNSPASYAGGQVLHINNPSGRSVLRLGDDEPMGRQWEISSSVFETRGMLNFSNITNLINPLTLLANGNVGIGTTNPLQPLEVNGNIALSGSHLVYNSANGVIDWGNAGSGDLYFRTLNSQGNISPFADRMIITNGGNVGVGTTTPTSAAGGPVVHINNSGGPSALRLGDGAPNGQQWEIQSTVIAGGQVGMLIFSNITKLTRPFSIDEFGRVGLGVESPANPFELASGAYCSGTGAWVNASSREYKTDIKPLKNEEYSDILKKLEDLEVVHFKYKSEPDADHIGMIAEDVPEEIATPDRKGIPTADAIAFLMAAVKAQQSQIEDLKATVKELKGLQKNE